MKIFLIKIFSFCYSLQVLVACNTAQTNSAPQTVIPAKDLVNASTELGHYLFFDKQLSFNQTKSCSSCHDPSLAFTDGYRTSATATGDNVKRNAPSLVNVVFQKRFDWANPAVTNTFLQNERPLFNQSPVELGVKNNEETILHYFRNSRVYQRLFKSAYPADTAITLMHIRKSLSDFVNSIVSSNAPYDAFIKGDTAKLSASAKKGLELFISPQLQCAACHTAPLFTLNDKGNTISADSIYFNTGLDGFNSAGDEGLYLFTHQSKDKGKFKVPSLRNIALTGPYMHDGSVASLSEVIDIYSRGGRMISKKGMISDGRLNPNKDPRLKGFSISTGDKKNLLEFLYSLTDSTITENKSFANPHDF